MLFWEENRQLTHHDNNCSLFTMWMLLHRVSPSYFFCLFHPFVFISSVHPCFPWGFFNIISMESFSSWTRLKLIIHKYAKACCMIVFWKMYIIACVLSEVHWRLKMGQSWHNHHVSEQSNMCCPSNWSIHVILPLKFVCLSYGRGCGTNTQQVCNTDLQKLNHVEQETNMAINFKFMTQHRTTTVQFLG